MKEKIHDQWLISIYHRITDNDSVIIFYSQDTKVLSDPRMATVNNVISETFGLHRAIPSIADKESVERLFEEQSKIKTYLPLELTFVSETNPKNYTRPMNVALFTSSREYIEDLTVSDDPVFKYVVNILVPDETATEIASLLNEKEVSNLPSPARVSFPRKISIKYLKTNN